MKTLFKFLILSLTLIIMVIPTLAATEIKVTLNGTQITFPDAKPFIDENNRTLVPVRFVSEALGSTVDYNNGIVTVKKGSTVIILKINNKIVTVNGKSITLDTNSILKNTRTYVPIRFISETFGAFVDYKNSTVIITTGTQETPSPSVTPKPISNLTPTQQALHDSVNVKTDLDSSGKMTRAKSREFENVAIDCIKLNTDGTLTGIVPKVLPTGFHYTIGIYSKAKSGAFEVLYATDDYDYKAIIATDWAVKPIKDLVKVTMKISVETNTISLSSTGYQSVDLITRKKLVDHTNTGY